LRAVDAGTLKGFYDFPGGRVHVEEFKTPLLKILKREVKEEIGDVDFEIKPRPIAWGRHEISAAFSSSGKAIHIFYLYFEAEYKKGTVKISKEHQGYKWLNLDKINPNKYFKSGFLQGVKMYRNL